MDHNQFPAYGRIDRTDISAGLVNKRNPEGQLVNDVTDTYVRYVGKPR